MRGGGRVLPLRQKLVLWYMGLLLVLLSAFSGGLYVFLRDSLYGSADAALYATAVNIARLRPQHAPGLWSLKGRHDLLERMLGSRNLNKYTQVVDITGRSAPAWLEARKGDFPLTQRALRNAAEGKLTYEIFATLGPHPVRLITLPVIADGRVTDSIVQVGASLESVEAALHKLALTLLFLLPGSLLIASLGGWFLANQALKPVDRITRSVRRIHAQNLKERLEEPPTDDEIGRLVETFNETLERLDQSFKQVRSFTADASHELKTPLTILKGEIGLALRRQRSVEEYQEVLGSAYEEIERLTRITEDLLLLAKSDADAVALERKPVNLSALIEEAVLHLYPLAEEKQVVLEAHPGRQDVRILGDAFRLKQMILNLVENAIHYTPSGGRVVVRTDRESPLWARIEVSDTGIGIAEEDHGRIFERFYRSDKARSRREGGTGLGLAIVKWIVECHGGKIELHSKPQRGATFTVLLPYQPEALWDAETDAPHLATEPPLLH